MSYIFSASPEWVVPCIVSILSLNFTFQGLKIIWTPSLTACLGLDLTWTGTLSPSLLSSFQYGQVALENNSLWYTGSTAGDVAVAFNLLTQILFYRIATSISSPRPHRTKYRQHWIGPELFFSAILTWKAIFATAIASGTCLRLIQRLSFFSYSLPLLPPPTLLLSNFHDGISESTNCYYNLLDVRPYRNEYVPFRLSSMLEVVDTISHSWISGRECKSWHRSQRWKCRNTPVSSIDKLGSFSVYTD